MRFLADESCDFAVVRALRADGHDVLAVSEFRSRSEDHEVIELGFAENLGPRTLSSAVRRLVAEQGAKLVKAFVVLLPGSARISTKPPAVRF